MREMNTVKRQLEIRKIHKCGKMIKLKHPEDNIPKCHKCGKLCTGYYCRRCYKIRR